MKISPILFHSEFRILIANEHSNNFNLIKYFISIFQLSRSGNQSESEYEDDEQNEIVLPQTLNSRGNIENNKSAIRMYEIGPRMTIELIKIQNDLFTGEVLYHNTIVKTEEEIAEMKKAREEKKRSKEMRKKAQEANVEKKVRKKEDHKKRSMKANTARNEDDGGVDNDADYYREEIGEEPDEGIFARFQISRFCDNGHLVYSLFVIIF